MLEDLSIMALQVGSENLVQNMFVHYTDFIFSESAMFCLKQPSDSFISYNSLNKRVGV